MGATKIGIAVYCTICGKRKDPHGRSAPLGFASCTSECPGYNQEPKPGCLWPGETDEEFGYPCCNNATEALKEAKP